MRVRSYLIGVLVGITALFAGVAATNYLLDPQGVFGNINTDENIPNWNFRYQKYRVFRSAPKAHDGVVLGSSRAVAFIPAAVEERFGLRQVAEFAVPFGLMTDHLPVLEYVLRDADSRGSSLKLVLLVVDADMFGRSPWTNVNLNAYQPPQVSGEPGQVFWLRQLTAYQPKAWRFALSRVIAEHNARRPLPDATVAGGQPAAAAVSPSEGGGPAAAVLAVPELSWLSPQSEIANQLAMLERLVALCRERAIRLVVLMSPMTRTGDFFPDRGALERFVEDVARITPVWDFSRPDWLPRSRAFWYDWSHYTPLVANMMMDRVLGKPIAAPDDFGRLRGAVGR